MAGTWTYDAATGEWSYDDPNDDTNQWAEGKPSDFAPLPKPAPTIGQTRVANQFDVLRSIQDDENKWKAIETKMKIDQFGEQMKLAREQMARDDARLQAQLAESGADRASRERMHAESLANQRQLAEMEDKTRRLSISLQAAVDSGFIPESLAKQLGIQGGPTLEGQKFAWDRFMQALDKASKPTHLPSFLMLQHGVQYDANKPIPFLDALANAQKLPVSQISGNQEAISSTARNWMADQLEAMPPTFQNERINPNAIAPVAGGNPINQLTGNFNWINQLRKPFGGMNWQV